MLIFVLPSFQKVCTTSVDCPAAFLCDNKVFPLPGFCVNPLTDFGNCGSLGNVCGPTQTCIGGLCDPPNPCAGGCPAGFTCTGLTAADICVDTMANSAHCGKINFGCLVPKICTAGICTPPVAAGCGASAACIAPLVCTDNSSTTAVCVDLQANDDHCGILNNACSTTEACIAGVCKPLVIGCGTTAACVAPFVCTNSTPTGICVNLQTNNAHCGDLVTVCAAGETCTLGICEPPAAALCGTTGVACDLPFVCSSTTTTGLCVDLENDLGHCGRIGNVCPIGNSCDNGICTPPPPVTPDPSTPAPETPSPEPVEQIEPTPPTTGGGGGAPVIVVPAPVIINNPAPGSGGRTTPATPADPAVPAVSVSRASSSTTSRISTSTTRALTVAATATRAAATAAGERIDVGGVCVALLAVLGSLALGFAVGM